MRLFRRVFLPLLLAVGCLMVPASALASFSLSISDQSANVFSQPLFQRLHLQDARLVVSWNAAEQPRERAQVAKWLAGAAVDNEQPLIAFGWLRGPNHAPSVAAYTKAVTAFHQDFPSVTTLTVWNEANDGLQPTAHKPVLAAEYYNALVTVCPSCTIVAADVLDQSGMTSWIKSFRRVAKGNPQLWGLHDYEDVNYHRDSGTRAFLADVPGTVWLTETGGIVRFGNFKYNPRRAAADTRYLFRIAASSSRIQRVYLYNWFGSTTAHTRACRIGQRGCQDWDSGLVNTNGTPRPAYKVVAAEAKQLGQ